jgi:hypothetical protein
MHLLQQVLHLLLDQQLLILLVILLQECMLL